jgi:hypothetical protein
MLCEELRHLVIELGEVILDQSQFFERQLHEPAIDGVQGRTKLRSRSSTPSRSRLNIADITDPSGVSIELTEGSDRY